LQVERTDLRARAAPRGAGEPVAALATLLALTDDGVVVAEVGGRILALNDGARAMLGLSSQAAPDTADAVLEHAAPHDSMGRPLSGPALVRLADQPLGVAVRLRPRDRPHRWVRVSSAAAMSMRVLLLRDISDARAAEESAYRYRRLLDLAVEAVYLIEPGTLRLVYANAGAVRQTGLSHEALEALTLPDLLPVLEPAAIGEIAADRHGRAPDGLTTVATVLRLRDQSLVPVDVTFQPFEMEPATHLLMASIRDASERVDVQARLQRLVIQEGARAAELEAMLGAIGDAVLVFGADGRVALANPASRHVFAGGGLRTFAQFLARLDDPASLAPRLGDVQPQGPVELRLRGRDDRWLEISAYPVIVTPGDALAADPASVSATILVCRDVTTARDQRRMREAFLGVLSHELRTPVTTILGGSRVLHRRQRLPAATRRELAQDIEAESERLYRLVEDLLVLARYEDQALVAAADEPLLLQRVLPGLVLLEEARWPGVRFELSIAPGLTTVRGERTYLEQVVRNLIGNAAKYAGRAGPIEIRAEAGTGEAVVRILDRGPGFPAAQRKRLFDLYFRAPGSALVAPGAGIGLFVCRRLIEAMDGRIWARQRPGGGAEFGFALRALSEEDP
jgi:signal transduction histidine kinase